MKQTISFCDFQDAFFKMGKKDSFSYEGKRALFDYLEQYEQDTGEEMELDVIALDCDFTEYSDFEEIKDTYPDLETLEDLYDKTQVIEVKGGGYIIQNY